MTAEVGREVMAEVPGGVPDHTPLVRYHAVAELSEPKQPVGSR